MNQTPSPQYCPQCGKVNHCAIAAGDNAQSCWCMQMPPVSGKKAIAGNQCLCSDCLAKNKVLTAACADKP